MRLHFTLTPSNYLFLVLSFLHFFAVVVLFLLIGYLGVWSIAVFPLLLASLLFHVRRDARLNLASSCIAIELEKDRVLLFTRSGNHQVVKLLRYSLVTPFVVILNVGILDSFFGRSIVVMPDSTDSESFRRLRVALRWLELPVK
jgi:hypothetical protein